MSKLKSVKLVYENGDYFLDVEYFDKGYVEAEGIKVSTDFIVRIPRILLPITKNYSPMFSFTYSCSKEESELFIDLGFGDLKVKKNENQAYYTIYPAEETHAVV